MAPTLMVTGRSARGVYAQPAAELARLTRGGATIKLAHGFYAAVPVDKRDRDWLPSLEDMAAGIATAVYGVGNGALWDCRPPVSTEHCRGRCRSDTHAVPPNTDLSRW